MNDAGVAMPSAYRKENRRKVKPGYPKTTQFTTPEQLEAYFGGDQIVCLRCGKKYNTLGVHLKTIHDMEPDEYRKLYGIPWTYGLSCNATKNRHSELAKLMWEDGKWVPATAERMAKLKQYRNRQPVSYTLAQRNLKKLNENKSGETQQKRNAAPRRGTPEFSQMMAQRPQCQNVSPDFKYWWVGKQQSDEHVRKRMANRNKKDG